MGGGWTPVGVELARPPARPPPPARTACLGLAGLLVAGPGQTLGEGPYGDSSIPIRALSVPMQGLICGPYSMPTPHTCSLERCQKHWGCSFTCFRHDACKKCSLSNVLERIHRVCYVACNPSRPTPWGCQGRGQLSQYTYQACAQPCATRCIIYV